VVSNSFSAGDIITINNTVELEFGVHWTAGASIEQTARNILQAITASGVQYAPSPYGEVVLVEKGVETTLSVFSNTPSVVVRSYAVAEALTFVPYAKIVDDENNGRKLVHQGEPVAWRT
jgi:hypothetical protein